MRLMNQRRERRGRIFLQEVAALNEQFESLHSDYLQSLLRYRDSIANGPYDLTHPVLEMIRADELFAGGLRNKLQAGWKQLSLEKDETGVYLFLNAVLGYVNEAHEAAGASYAFPQFNAVRASLKSGLQHIFALDAKDVERIRKAMSNSELAFDVMEFVILGTDRSDEFQRARDLGVSKRLLALVLIDQAVRDVQDRYSRVAMAFANARHELSVK